MKLADRLTYSGRRLLFYSRYLLAFLLPMGLFTFIFSAESVQYENSYTLLTSDLNGQYVYYLQYFRNAILSGDNIFYSFSALLGSDMTGIITYYILSPFNILILLYPAERITSAIYLISLLKISLSGLAFNIFISKHTKTERLYTVAFSTIYALSGYTMFAFFQLMWLDALYLLPFIACSLDYLVLKGKKATYAFLIAMGIITNYYCGFMLCIAAVIYFFYIFVTESVYKKRDIIYFCISSVIGGIVSMISLLPAIWNTIIATYADRVASGSAGIYSKAIISTVTEVLSSFFTGTYFSTDLREGEPQIYMTMIPLVFLVIFFNSKRPKKEKIPAIIILTGLFACFFIQKLNIIWYGFTINNGFNFRYSYVFIFFVLMFSTIACEDVYNNADTRMMVFFASEFVLVFAVFYAVSGADFGGYFNLAVDIITIIMLAVNGLRTKYPAKRLNLTESLLALTIISLVVNGQSAVKTYTYDDGSYSAFQQEMDSLVAITKQGDSDFFRTEKLFYNSVNDPMMASYNGLSHFSSGTKIPLIQLMEKMGYTRVWNFYTHYDYGATLAGDSLFGVKYLFSKSDSNQDLLTGYRSLKASDNYYINLNNSALQIGTMTNSSILGELPEAANPFELQTVVYNNMLGYDTALFTQCELSEFEFVNSYLEEDNTYNISGDPAGSFVNFRFTPETDDLTSMYMYCPGSNITCEIYINGEIYSEYMTVEHHGILPLGCFTPGEEVEIGIRLTYKITLTDICVYTQNTENILSAASELRSRGWNVSSHSNNGITATVTSDSVNDTLFMTIPTSDGWTLYIDGTKAPIENAMGVLMAAKIPTGTHTVELMYSPPMVKQGFIIFVFGVLLLLSLCLWDLFDKDIHISRKAVPESIADSKDESEDIDKSECESESEE